MAGLVVPESLGEQPARDYPQHRVLEVAGEARRVEQRGGEDLGSQAPAKRSQRWKVGGELDCHFDIVRVVFGDPIGQTSIAQDGLAGVGKEAVATLRQNGHPHP